jgi:hypothetical protein
MKPIHVLAGCALAMTVAGSAMAETSWNVNINLGNAPPPPVVVVQQPPTTVWLPDARVAVVRDPDFDYDCFQVGANWYVYRSNYWYRARSWRGPFVVIDERYVPHSVTMVPARHWRGGRKWGGPHKAAYAQSRGHHVEPVRVKNHGSTQGKGKKKGH